MEWKEGELISAKVLSKLGNPLKIRYKSYCANFDTGEGQLLCLDRQLREDRTRSEKD